MLWSHREWLVFRLITVKIAKSIFWGTSFMEFKLRFSEAIHSVQVKLMPLS